MIVKSIKGDGIEHLLGPVPTDFWGWEALEEYLHYCGLDVDTGEPVHRETERRVFGKVIEVELHNNGDDIETIGVVLWSGGSGCMSCFGTTPKEVPPGESRTWSLIMEEARQATWCLLRLTEK